MEENEVIKLIKELFDAEFDEFFPDNDQLEFIEKRDQIEKNLSLNFEAYVNNYDLIKSYGLELKLIQELKWFIVLYLENDYKRFIESDFYRKFKNNEVVQRAFLEYKRRMELKNEN